MTLTASEFIRRFLIHVLPAGFHRIRHYGLFASGNRVDNIARARQLCPCCGGRMIIIETFARGCSPRTRPTEPITIDSS